MRQDPYQGYRIPLDREPVMRSYQNRGWMILGYDENREMFRDPRFARDMRVNPFLVKMIRFAAGGRPMVFIDNPTVLNLDPTTRACANLQRKGSPTEPSSLSRPASKRLLAPASTATTAAADSM
ncbi:MAG: hypothetical protein CMQ24_01745 [Gammaproteobacteria bacterium]|nr:hypothetical protein [Gammaproteobacteria bacterium]